MSSDLSRDRRPPAPARPGTAVASITPGRWSDLESLLGDWYWELDSELRFTRIRSPGRSQGFADAEGLLGRRCWEIGAEIESPGGWQALRTTLEAHDRFRDIILRGPLPDGTQGYLSIAGVPMRGADGSFAGYRGIARDVTEEKQHEEDLVRFRAAIDASPDPVYLTDPETLEFLYVNDAAWQRSGYSRDELLRKGPGAVLYASADDLKLSYQAVMAAGDAGVVTEIPARDKQGRRTVVELRRRAVKLGGRHMIVSISRDLAQRIRADRAIGRLTRMLAALSSTNEAIMHAKTPRALYQRVCEAAVHGGQFLVAAVLVPRQDSHWFEIAAATGAMSEHLRDTRVSSSPDVPEGRGLAGSAFRDRDCRTIDDFTKDSTVAPWRAMAADAGIKSGAATPLLRDGEPVGVLLLYSSERHAFDDEAQALLQRMGENIQFALGRFELEAERKRADERVQYLATHDALTGLPNRMMFGELLTLALESARRYRRRFAVLFVDLDRFKVVNDTLGHEAGDVLLKQMAARFRQSLRASDVIARLGGDEFVVLVQEVARSHQVATVAHKLIAAASEPVTVLGHDCRVTASVGISMFPGDSEDEKSLLKNADIAMYLAKEQGKNTYQFYSADVRAQALERLAIETHLRRAMEENELSLHYQARLDLNTQRVAGVEALLRWNNATLGTVVPERFLPVAEDTGLIVPIGRWVLRTACAQSMAWQRQGLPPLYMSVNLSLRQFSDPDLVQHVRDVLGETGLPPELLELEVTEGVVMKNPELAAQKFAALKALGVRLTIDRFGTGYSSLAQLRRSRVDTLKVDRSIIDKLPRHTEDRAITDAIISLGRSLSLTIVAGGVETAQQQDYLSQQACPQMQGFHFSKPLTAGDLADLMRSLMRTPSH